MAKERLDKILSAQGVASRSEVKTMIRRGLVTVDGEVVRAPEDKFDPELVSIAVEGRQIGFKRHLYIMMNKPEGVICATSDGRIRTVVDLLPEHLQRRGLFPAGRLDRDTTGFVLITDDGELAHRMLAPKSHVYKLYEVGCDRTLCDDDVKSFAEGIVHGDEHFQPAKMKLTGDNTALVEICEGKFHQIKKMFTSVGAVVTSLRRIRIGEVSLDATLAPGECRELSSEEVQLLLSRKSGF